MYFKQINKLIKKLKNEYVLPVFIDWGNDDFNHIISLLNEEEMAILQEVQKEMNELGLQGDAKVYLFQCFISETFSKNSALCNKFYKHTIPELPLRIYYNDAKEAIKFINCIFNNEPLKARILEISIIANEEMEYEEEIEETNRCQKKRKKEKNEVIAGEPLFMMWNGNVLLISLAIMFIVFVFFV